MQHHELSVQNLHVCYGERTVIKELALDIPAGQITTIVGPNACGKSTLLRSMSRLLQPKSGHVLLDGTDIHRMPAKALARTLGLLPQTPIAPEGITVADLVGRGRQPHQSIFSRWSRADDEAVAEALELTNSVALADRSVDELSGGQRQRVWIAMALAQGTDILLLDEPTTFLDVSHQVDVLDLLTDLNRTQGTTVVMVLHDLNLAARYADYLVAMRDGSIRAQGTPGEILTEDVVNEVFGLSCRVIQDPTTNKPLVLPWGRHHMLDEMQPEASGH
ncbi:ABC transporter ATP-binding protein [Glutamicibacter sp. NPDC087344]|uniref:ABC transporter ATP-binding protein n=1 Tax=Glutamicibacter sp. NPDC087344 TaxID=3363994 RepID=UPI003802DC06